MSEVLVPSMCLTGCALSDGLGGALSRYCYGHRGALTDCARYLTSTSQQGRVAPDNGKTEAESLDAPAINGLHLAKFPPDVR